VQARRLVGFDQFTAAGRLVGAFISR